MDATPKLTPRGFIGRDKKTEFYKCPDCNAHGTREPGTVGLTHNEHCPQLRKEAPSEEISPSSTAAPVSVADEQL